MNENISFWKVIIQKFNALIKMEMNLIGRKISSLELQMSLLKNLYGTIC